MSAFDAVFRLVLDFSRSFLGLLTNDAVFIVLMLIVLSLLFRYILLAGLSFLPAFSNDNLSKFGASGDAEKKRKQMLNVISTILGLLFSLGLLGFAGYNSAAYSFSVGNIKANLGRILTVFGSIGVWFISASIAGLVYFIIKKMPRSLGKKKSTPFEFGMVMLVLGVFLLIGDNLIGNPDSLGPALLIFSFITLISGVSSMPKIEKGPALPPPISNMSSARTSSPSPINAPSSRPSTSSNSTTSSSPTSESPSPQPEVLHAANANFDTETKIKDEPSVTEEIVKARKTAEDAEVSAITESKDETKVIKKDEKELKKVEKKAIKKESKLEIEETLLDFKEGFAAENEQRLLSSLINLRQVCAAGDAVEIKAALETVEKNMNTTLDGRATNRLIRHIKRDGEFFVKDLNDLENYINRIKDKGDLYALKKNSDTLSKELEACITELEDLKNNVVVISGSLNEIAVLNKSLNKFENTYNPSKKIKSVFDTIKKNLKSETPIDPSWFNDIIGIETERSNIFKSEISYENIADNAVEVLKNHAKNNFHHMDATITELNKTLRKELNDFAKKMGHNMKTYNAVSTEYKKIKKQELVLDSILKPIVKITASQVYDRGQPVDVPEKHDEELALVIKTIFDSLVMIEKEIVAIDETDAEIYHKYYLFATDKKKNLIHDAEGSMLDRSVRVKNYYSKIAELLGFSVGIHDA